MHDEGFRNAKDISEVNTRFNVLLERVASFKRNKAVLCRFGFIVVSSLT